MKVIEYIKKHFNQAGYVAYLALCAVAGVIPAAVIIVRAKLIDDAAATLEGSVENAFFIFLSLFCAMSLASFLLKAIITRITERHKIRASARFDFLRLNKASCVEYSLTETKEFHSLLNKFSKAAELDVDIWKSSGDFFRNATAIMLSVIVIAFADPITAFGIIVLLAVGIVINRHAAGTTEGFWAGYIENMRRTNYFSSMFTRSRFAAERKIFAYDDEIERRYDEEFAKAVKLNARSGRRRLSAEAVMQIMIAVYAAAVVLLLVRPLLAESITIGAFTSVFYSALRLQTNIKQLCESVFTATQSAKEAESLSEFMSLTEESGGKCLPRADSYIVEFKNVTFTYPGSKAPVLKNISFKAENGKHYAIVGENGCGKSTLAKLLLGLYSPDSGEVTINGCRTGELLPTARREVFASVFQDFYRYPLTIRQNASLCLGEELSDEELERVFDKLAFHPKTADGKVGYDSVIMPFKKQSAGLSGGEWQKLAVARCILSAAPVVVLDEPNASLDAISEAAVYGAYRDMLEGRTAFFISHRLGSVRGADKILVIKDGNLIAAAPHSELMEHCAYYAELYNTQKEMYDERKQ